MTVSLIRTVESHTGTTGSTSAASYTWAVGQAGDTPRGIVVFTMQGVSATEKALQVTYGGVPLHKVPSASAADSATEPGRVTAWILGASVPQGAQSVVVTRTNDTTPCYAVAFLLGGSYDLETKGTPVLQEGDGTVAPVSIAPGAATSIVLAAAYSGDNTPAPVGNADMTVAHTLLGTYAYSFGSAYETTPTTGTRTRGCTQSTSDDRAHVVLAVGEVVGTGIYHVRSWINCLDAAATPLTVTPDAGVIQDGDILILAGYDASTTTWVWPSGFAEIEAVGANEHGAAWKRASSESGGYNITKSGGGNLEGGATLSVFRGCLASGDPVDVFSSTTYTTDNTILRCAAVTTTVAAAMLVATGHAGAYSTTPMGWLPPTGFVKLQEEYGVAYGEGLGVACGLAGGAGSTGDKDFTLVITATDKHGMLIALKPAVSTVVHRLMTCGAGQA